MFQKITHNLSVSPNVGKVGCIKKAIEINAASITSRAYKTRVNKCASNIMFNKSDNVLVGHLHLNCHDLHSSMVK